jgi:cell division protein FtsB
VKTVLAGLLLVLVLLQVRLWAGSGGVGEIVRLEDKIGEQAAENATLEARNSTLMEEVGDLRNGLDSIEERARNELGLIRRGETFYLIVDKEQGAAAQPEPEVAQLPNTVVVPESLPPEMALELPPEIALEPPPEIVEDDNPYLDVFRDEDDTSTEARAPDVEADATTGQ